MNLEPVRLGSSALGEDEIITRVLAGELELFELLMRRNNQRVFRTARAILRDDGEAEDVMQDAYVRAYASLRTFERRASFSTWLTKIAVYEALARVRRRRRFDLLGASPRKCLSIGSTRANAGQRLRNAPFVRSPSSGKTPLS